MIAATTVPTIIAIPKYFIPSLLCLVKFYLRSLA